MAPHPKQPFTLYPTSRPILFPPQQRHASFSVNFDTMMPAFATGAGPTSHSYVTTITHHQVTIIKVRRTRKEYY
jgi:hypothetical protein